MNKLSFLLTALTIILSGCGNNKPKTTTWEYKKNINQLLVAKAGNEDQKLGDISTDKVRVTIPAKAFDVPQTVSILNPESVPPLPAEKFSPVGSPIEVQSDQKRFNEPMTIVMAIDPHYQTDLERGNIWVVYFNGKNWDIFKPSTIDVSNLTLSFQTYHASLWGTVKVDIEEQINQYTHSRTLSGMAQKNVDKIVEKIVEAAVDNLLLEQLKMGDKSAKYKIISSLANDDEYTEILSSFARGDAEGFNKKLMVFMGKKIAENVSASSLQSALKNLSSGAGTAYVEAISQALGYLSEGDLEDTGRVIGEKIASSFLVTKLFQAAGEIVQYNINLWKNAEVEAAYQAYKNGADQGYWGYNVEKGDFHGLYNQMRGIAVRLESEYVQKEINRRAILGLSEPTDAELREIREQAGKDLEEQFKLRMAKDEELEKEAQKMKLLISKFREAKLLEDGSFGYDADNDSLENRLDQLIKLSEKILKDTGRKNWNTGAFTNEKEISVNDMASLMQAWYSTDGKAQYEKLLQDKFGIGEDGAIQGDFNLISDPDIAYMETSYQGYINEDLMKKTKIEVRNGKFDVSYSQPYDITVKESKFVGNGWNHLQGTYNKQTAILTIQYEFGWDGVRNDSAREKVVYAGITQLKILASDKRITMNHKGTATKTVASKGADGEYGKSFTTTDEAWPTEYYFLEVK